MKLHSGLLVVGQAPSRDTDGGPPFSGRSGRRLAELLGVDHARLLRDVDAVNLLDAWPGKHGKGDAWDAELAAAAGRVLMLVAPHDRIVACGGLVCRALGLASLGPLGRRQAGGRLVLHLPHPSGVNRWWNDPDNERQARAVLRTFAAAGVAEVG